MNFLHLLLTAYLGYGEAGIWISTGLVWGLSALTSWIRYFTYFGRKIDMPSKSVTRLLTFRF